MSLMDRGVSRTATAELGINRGPLQERESSLDSEGTFADVTATFSALADHHAKRQERQDVLDIIRASETLKSLTAKITKAYGDRLDLRDRRAIAHEMYRYTQQLHGKPSQADRERLDSWYATLDHYLKVREELAKLTSKYDEVTAFHDPDARDALAIVRRGEVKKERGAAVESLRSSFTQKDPAAFNALRDELDAALNKGGRKIDLMDTEQVARAINAWKTGLGSATTESQRAQYSRWINKLETLNALRPVEQKSPAAEVQRPDSSTNNSAMEALLANKQRNEKADPAIKARLEEAIRLHPESIHRFMLQEALRKGYLKEREKTVGEDLLNALTAQDRLHVAEDRWYTKNFGGEYLEQKARKTELERRGLALYDWYDKNREGHTSTVREVIGIEEQFNNDPEYTEVIQQERRASQALEKACKDIARTLEGYLEDKNEVTKSLFISRSAEGAVDPEFVRGVLYSLGNVEQKTILKNLGIMPDEAMRAVGIASRDLRSARADFLSKMQQEVALEQASLRENLEAMKASKRSDYTAELRGVTQAAEQANAKIRTDTHRKLSDVLSGKMEIAFGSRLDETLLHQDNLARRQKYIFSDS